jgi:hypothetical protein
MQDSAPSIGKISAYNCKTAREAYVTPRSQQWPAQHIERRSIEQLTPNDRKARMHSEVQVAELAASLLKFGWALPLLIDEQGVLIAGHGRLLGALSALPHAIFLLFASSDSLLSRCPFEL